MKQYPEQGTVSRDRHIPDRLFFVAARIMTVRLLLFSSPKIVRPARKARQIKGLPMRQKRRRVKSKKVNAMQHKYMPIPV